MPKRRANGEGNIRKRKDGRWEGRYTAGYDANGKAITKNVLGRTQAEVKEKLRNAIEDSKKLDPVKAGSYTLEQWLKLWYSIYVEPQVRYSTREFYHNAIDHHIIPKLGSVKLEKLTMLQIQQFYNELLKSGRVQKKNQPELKEHGLSPRMVQCVHVVLNKALEHAVEEKLILANPAKKCKIPKNTREEMNILPPVSGSASSGAGSSVSVGSGSTPTHLLILTEQTAQSVLTAPATHFSEQEHTACSTPAASAAASRSASSTTFRK